MALSTEVKYRRPTGVIDVDRQGFRILDTRIDALTMDLAVELTESFVEKRSKASLAFCTASTLLEARRDPKLRAALESAELVTPDGMPLVWLGRRFSSAVVDRVYGPDFMLALFAATRGSLRHFFYGGEPEVAAEMVARLKERFPDLVIAGTHSPGEVDPENPLDAHVELINAAEPDIVWVGLGHPKQEIWMHAHRQVLDASVLAGVGAAFDFLSGRKKEAPEWMKRLGLQWFHRLVHEPRRLWRRYLIGNPKFALLVLRELASGRISR